MANVEDAHPHPHAHALPTLLATDLACRRGDRLLFAGLGFELPAGRMLWLRGRNGRGKTSLLRLVTGLAVPECGELLWGGEPLRRSARYRDERIYLAHAQALKDELTAAESLAFLARIHGVDDSRERVQRGLDAFGLSRQRDAPVRTLSPGQRKRIALARLILADARPALWVLDEPFDGLDADGADRLLALLDAHLRGGGSLLLTSHQPLWGSALRPAELDLDRLH